MGKKSKAFQKVYVKSLEQPTHKIPLENFNKQLPVLSNSFEFIDLFNNTRIKEEVRKG